MTVEANKGVETPSQIFSTTGMFARYQPPSAQDRHLYAALEANKREGLLLAVQARWIALAVSAVLSTATVQSFEVVWYHVLMALMALNGYFQLRAGRVGRSFVELFLLELDVVLMVVALALPNPLAEWTWPPGTAYKFGLFYFFFVLLTATSLGYSYRTVISFGTWTAVIWMAVALGLWYFGWQDPNMSASLLAALDGDERLLAVIDPNDVRLIDRFTEAVLFIIISAMVALGSYRSNRLLIAQAEVQRERGNLSRYFAPSMVEALASRDDPFSEVRSQKVVILFADIVGFTAMAEKMTPQEVIDTLRDFHARAEKAVFDQAGTLDKYLGDGLMVTFGTPDAGPDDATRAMICADGFRRSIEEWNVTRVARGLEPVRLSIGIHYGPVIMGEIGSERRMELATLGDSVNVAARLESATRQLDTDQVVSEAFVERLKREGAGGEKLLADFQPGAEPLSLRGRNQKIAIWRRCESQ